MSLNFFTTLFSKSKNSSIPTTIDPNSIPKEELDAVMDLAIEEALNASAKTSDQTNLSAANGNGSKINFIDFELTKEMDASTFETNNDLGICKITWHGVAQAETVESLVSMGADVIEFEGYKKLILDRSDLTEFDTEARIWIKGFLKERARHVAKKTEKVAIINATTAKGSIFSDFISTTIGLLIPTLEMKKFDNLPEAYSWLLKK
jgi:hypothetical protein